MSYFGDFNHTAQESVKEVDSLHTAISHQCTVAQCIYAYIIQLYTTMYVMYGTCIRTRTNVWLQPYVQCNIPFEYEWVRATITVPHDAVGLRQDFQ